MQQVLVERAFRPASQQYKYISAGFRCAAAGASLIIKARLERGAGEQLYPQMIPC